ncbi:MAG TPA: hypothetical protein VFK02_13025 [Kofleriaceae bacterium]|nr:hypothetical protein [Kofleriaceae bacterium]
MLAVLARGLDPDPARRWRSVEALAEALDRAREQAHRRARHRRWALAALAVLACAGAAAALIAR